jgi:cation:H+ antiporter
MAMWLFGAGLVLLALGGEAVIRGGVTLTRALRLSPVIVGLFAISLGTSSPTLAVAVRAAASNLPDIAIGTVIGATLVNLLLILGIGALIRPMPSAPKVVLRDGGAMLAAAIVLAVLALHGQIGRREGVLLLGGFLVYAVIAVVSDWRRHSEHSVACAEAENRSQGQKPSAGGGLFALTVGVICLLIGAHFTVGGALTLATLWHVPSSAIAMTIVALGASLPVLAITAIAAARGYTEIAIGHLITASVFNVFAVLGIAALVRPLTIAPSFAAADVLVVLGAVVLLLPLLSSNWLLSRAKGAMLMLAYLGYLGFLAWRLGFIPHGLI